MFLSSSYGLYPAIALQKTDILEKNLGIVYLEWI
jgi:hypothetical protein